MGNGIALGGLSNVAVSSGLCEASGVGVSAEVAETGGVSVERVVSGVFVGADVRVSVGVSVVEDVGAVANRALSLLPANQVTPIQAIQSKADARSQKRLRG